MSTRKQYLLQICSSWPSGQFRTENEAGMSATDSYEPLTARRGLTQWTSAVVGHDNTTDNRSGATVTSRRGKNARSNNSNN